MRFNIDKLKAAGFYVQLDGETIAIDAPPMSARDWEQLKARVEAFGIRDPGLVEYVMSSFAIAVQRAQVLEIAE